ncbi:MAG: hypothetical protein MUC81_09460, partial [Bacteroidia bacterium]|nr:hypothetical protein [Bacteroidia bacterium]
MTILFWVVMILFSIVKTKIVHYSSLCYVPLTFLAAYYVHDVLKRGIKLPLFKPLLVLLIGGLISFAFMALPFIDGFKHQIIPYINDPFAVASLRVDGHWNGGEWIKNGSQVLVDFIAYQIDLFVNPVAGHGQPW